MSMPIIKSALLLIMLLISTSAVQAKVKLPAVFGSNAVLQRGVPVKVWGWSDPNATVEGVLEGSGGQEKITARADSLGKFQLVFKPQEAKSPFTLEVSDAKDKALSTNLLFGEVWLCSGQSNFLTSLKGEKLLAEANKEGFSPDIRFFAPIPHLSTSPEPDTNTDWKILSQETGENFSALAYFFAVNLHKNLNVPVGIILSASPGAKVQSFCRMQGLGNFREGRAALSDFHTDFPDAGTKTESMEFSLEVLKQLNEQKELKTLDDKKDASSRNSLIFKAASTAYNTMIAPVAPFPIKGVLWYQGETNMREPGPYLPFFTGLIQDWRHVWQSPKMPFFCVQIAPFGERSATPILSSIGAIFRNMQRKACLFPYTYLVPAIDSCSGKNPDLHASNKKLLGTRLCNAALDTQYGKSTPYRSPKVEECQVENNKVRITFKYIGKGLKVNGTFLKGFAIAGGDKKLHLALAKLDGESVLVWSPEVDVPKIVTYAWDNNPDGNLFSLDSLPVEPFREELSAQKK